MIQVKIDGQIFEAGVAQVKTMPDLIELIKANIDPDSILVSLLINGNGLSESDWQLPLTLQSGNVLEVLTGSKASYLSERLKISGNLLEQISNSFNNASNALSESRAVEGSQALQLAVADLKAFVEWFRAVLELLPESEWSQELSAYDNQVSGIGSTCEQIFQQQIYQSWWAMGQLIETKLCPQLNALKQNCQVFQPSA